MSKSLVSCLACALILTTTSPHCHRVPGSGESPSPGRAVPPDTARGAAGERPQPAGRYGPLQDAFINVAREVIPSVVCITSERIVSTPENPYDFFFGDEPFGGGGDGRRFRQSGLGSGVIVGKEGFIL